MDCAMKLAKIEIIEQLRKVVIFIFINQKISERLFTIFNSRYNIRKLEVIIFLNLTQTGNKHTNSIDYSHTKTVKIVKILYNVLFLLFIYIEEHLCLTCTKHGLYGGVEEKEQ